MWARYLNPQTARVVRSIGFDRRWERGRGLLPLRRRRAPATSTSCRDSACSASGRSHPTVRQALHDVLDAELADMVQMDTPLLAGLLAEALIERAPDLDRVYMCNSGTEAVEAALKFARCATGRPRVLYCDHAFHGLTAGLAVGQRGQGVPGRLRPPAPGNAGALRRPRRPAPGAGGRATWPP